VTKDFIKNSEAFEASELVDPEIGSTV